ncbi:HEAT repeat domain-containing protein [bacterium]|nr:HEAT repeat domain-containing protein [bacterium]
MKLNRIVILIGIIGAGVLYLNSALALVVYTTLYEKLQYTELIAVGTITQKKVKSDKTYYRFRVEDVIHGNLPESSISIMTRGGRTSWVEDEAHYEAGETYLVFLCQNRGHYRTILNTPSLPFPDFQLVREAVEPLLELTKEQEPMARFQKLSGMLKSDNHRVVESAIVELGKLWELSSESFRLRKAIQATVPELIHLLQIGWYQNRLNAISTLNEIGGSEAITTIRAVFDGNLLDTLSPSLRNHMRGCAATALGRMRAYQSEDALIAAMSNRDEKMDVRRSAMFALGQLNSVKAIPYLEDVLEDAEDVDYPHFQSEIRDVMNRIIASKETTKRHAQLLKDSSPQVRYNAVEALAKYPSREVIEPLILLLADESIEVRTAATYTLWSWKYPEIPVRLGKLAQTSDITIAGTAVFSLAFHWGEEVDPEIIYQYLNQELRQLTGPPYYGTDVVINIIYLLGEIGTATSLKVLKEAKQHTHPAVREEAEKAIGKIVQTQTQR